MSDNTVNLNTPEIQMAVSAKLAERLNDVAMENELLRAQIAELLPWAQAGAITKCEAEAFIEPSSTLMIVGHILRMSGALNAQEMLARIEAGEFGEVA